jgi:hypothetical protein
MKAVHPLVTRRSADEDLDTELLRDRRRSRATAVPIHRQAPGETVGDVRRYGRVVRPRKLLRRLLAGDHDNVRFRDLQRLLDACGFELDRVTGSHHIYAHPDVAVNLNLQDVGGDAKPYQVRQFLRLVERYDLIPEELA